MSVPRERILVYLSDLDGSIARADEEVRGAKDAYDLALARRQHLEGARAVLNELLSEDVDTAE